MSEYKIDYCHHDSVTMESRQEYIKREDAENIMLGSCDESALWKLRYLPSADVEPVRHSAWIADLTNPYGIHYVCSVCGGVKQWKSNYCPNCGARMDGEEREHE